MSIKIDITNYRQKKQTINLKSPFAIAYCAYVLDKSRVVAEGITKELQKTDILERVFLGQAQQAK